MLSPSKYIQNLVYQAMEKRGISTYSEFARKAGTYPQKIRGKLTKRHRTYNDVCELSDALNYDVNLELVDRETHDIIR